MDELGVAACEACFCPYTFDELAGAREIVSAEWEISFECHCGWEDSFEVATWDWMDWQRELQLIFRDILERFEPHEVFDLWDAQRVATPHLIPKGGEV